ncbi:MAG: FtsQ-type POTRA domain-containing protein [Chloroflexia bacterium]
MPPRDVERRPRPATATSVGRPRGRVAAAPPARPEKSGAVAAPVGRAPRREESRPNRPSRLGAIWGTGRLAALVLAIVGTGLLIYLLTANALTVQQLAIRGQSLTSEQEIAASSGVMGHNIFTVDAQVVANRLTALPTVREAKVWGELPGRLVIHIVERQPALVWQLGNDRFLLDENGVVMAVNPPEERTRDLPAVTMRDVEVPQVGGQVDAKLVTTLAQLLRRAPEYGLPVAALDYSPKDGIVLHFDQNRQILLGTTDRLEEKLAASAAVAASDAGWTTLNVTDPDRPFFPAR